MSFSIPTFTLAIAIGSVAALSGLQPVRAQESWGGAGSLSSSWRVGPSPAGATSSSAHATTQGSSSSWTAGKGIFASGAQAGGVWHEVSALGNTGTKAPGATPPAGANPFSRSLAAGTTRPFRSSGALRASAIAHPSSGSHPPKGLTHGTSKSVFTQTGAGNSARISSSHGSMARKTTASSNFGSSMQGRSTLNSMGPSSSNPFTSHQPSTMEAMPH
jgi:hypothetical protein